MDENNYTIEYVKNSSADFGDLLVIPSPFQGFINSWTELEKASDETEAYCFHGDLLCDVNDYWCEECRVKMHIHDTYHVRLRHVMIGTHTTCVIMDKHRFICPVCGKTKMQSIPFKAEHHQITTELLSNTELLLSSGYTNKKVSELTGLGQHTVKAIDKERLLRLYTDGTEEKRVLKKPEKNAKYLAIDEFKLHDGYRFATHIIDLESGHVLWIQEGKKKQVVYDFIEHVGMDWMDNVEAVACDMNSDFQEAFEEKCPHIQPVFDRFHIIKNFNDKVISAVRKEEQARLLSEGNKEAAAKLKGSRYILMSSKKTLEEKDKMADAQALVTESDNTKSLFKIRSALPKSGRQEKYAELIQSNKLFFAADLVKEMLNDAYQSNDESVMAEKISTIIDVCNGTGNKHFIWFSNLLLNHFEGIIAHASIPVSSGRIEGINNKIKTIRRQAYGFPDDVYFFLKIIDASRKNYVRNPKSHKLFH